MAPPVSTEKFVNWITGQPMALYDATGSIFNPSGGTSSIGLVPDPGPTPGSPLRFLREDATWATVSSNPFLNSALPYFFPEGRLTWSTTEVVMTTSYSAQSSLYYYPYVGSIIPYFDGSSLWNLYDMGNAALPTFNLDSNSGHTGYHQAGKIFDVFFDYNAGSGRLVTSPAWTSDSARSNAIVRQNGIWLNNASIVCRFGTVSGDTATFSAKTLTYLGSFYCTANGQSGWIYGSAAAGGSPSYFALWNCYNRVYLSGGSYESTDSWTINVNDGMLPFNNSTNNRNYFLIGIIESAINVFACGFGAQTSTQYSWIGIGLNSVSTTWTAMMRNPSTTQITCATAIWANGTGVPSQLGWNYVQLLQFLAGGAGTSNTMYGDNGDPVRQQSGIIVGGFF